MYVCVKIKALKMNYKMIYTFIWNSFRVATEVKLIHYAKSDVKINYMI